MIQMYENYAKTEKAKSWVRTVLAKTVQKREQSLDQAEVEHIIDYLDSSSSPARIDRMTYDQAKSNTDKWLKAQIKKGEHILETDEDVEVVLRGKKSGFKLVRLVGEAAFKREGFLMSHCVASYANRKDTEVYSLRDEKNMPHCTIEVTRGADRRINQIKGKGNGPIHPKYIRYVLRILKYFKVEVRSSEMSNLGYITLSDDYWKFLDSNGFKGKEITYGGTRYLYKYEEPKRVSA
ncbi:MAG: hypothetical protein FMNOHCHN_03793 [Ignavibacteriaceae bacterium]|nr:hypothetical protein [Ignavibacteriaceae bacterium]